VGNWHVNSSTGELALESLQAISSFLMSVLHLLDINSLLLLDTELL
jgi:hypothetical protein